ncbi:MAG: carboxypeptidase regulatory-like domain-containing protein, partial [Calditrichaeota bacterium]|nr:carboxypeptidase regulatory-like domain-containing protein [Calditrichota bacterium]
MKKRKLTYGFLILLGMLFLHFSGTARADVLLVTPQRAVVAPGEGQQFRAQLFNKHAIPAPMGLIKWKVVPDTLGTITDDGYFVAGDHAGEGEIVARLSVSGTMIQARARVIVTHKKWPLRLEIFPGKRVVQIGDTLKFRVHASTVGSTPLPMLSFKWFVMPRGLAEISQRGVFVAKKYGKVTVVAFTEFLGRRYKAEATVFIAPEMSGAIAGTVQDEDSGTPLIGARVEAYRIGKIQWSRVARTDSLGNYELNNLLPGYYVVVARHKNTISEFYKDVRYLREATPVKVDSADTVSGIDFNLNHGAVLKGMVWAEGDSTALQGAHVKAVLVVNPLIRYHGVTDEDGAFRMAGIPTGTYILSADKEGFKKEYFDHAADPRNASPVSVTEPDSVENLNFTLETKSAITGQVLSATTGDPIARATVFVVRLKTRRFPGHWARHTQTDKNGNFVLSVPAGNYIVGAVAEGFGVEYFDNVTHINDATPVKVEDGLHTTGITFSLDPLASISGVVTSAITGAPIAHARVEAFPETWRGKRPYRVRTEEDGTFTIPNVRPGIYVIRAKAEGYLPEYYQDASRLKDATLVKIDLNQSVTDINFTLEKSGILAGRVTDGESGDPIAHAVVLAKKLNSPFSKVSMTREDGTFSIENLMPGKYRVSAIARGYHREFYEESASRDSATILEITDSDSLGDIDFTLDRLPVRGGISGLVFSDADSLPISGAWVMAFPKKGGRPFLTVTGSDGSYTFTNLHSGR